MIEFPKMLYRPRAMPNEQIGGLKLDTSTVNSEHEQATAESQGWITPLAKVLAIVEQEDVLKSELIVDIDNSIRKAYDSSLSTAEQKALRVHLAFVLTRLTEPNTQIEPAKTAIIVLENRMSKALPWFQRPFGILILAILGGVLIAGIVKEIGWI
ncbi:MULTISPECIES: hypothetical protein [unclassified Undibacterium]|uniref:hypothetical protein n=1 Tax=unclassified Undibacterium TaxID=2630295 RepID=UPI002AC952E4|nr:MULTISPECIES: hypothetical protein [unclassified Undibacterium]MEB0137994.1 hypothetical protein [Undibacterium sp. CCC2.1]MEB0170673.1 hypothetical protein [Undibacterium sp. CCC1.1]MEB0177014.1 hypothetical protein [Undibacterium sp. CCC3.4]MEB0216302.1 hypothetical protein [Undibacterium sp. 5I2]WPX42486.1 hypothetical protein RHM61_13950 [Undibacterium sp. CCC3.4]